MRRVVALLWWALLTTLYSNLLAVNVAAEEKYLCKGECNINRTRCGCTSVCVDAGTCCSDYVETCLNEPAWLDLKCTPQQEMQCPERFKTPPVILFSIDGFKAEYLFREKTPNIWKLASCGVHAPYMRSIYPTITFPSHHSIATGLYAESHGIIENSMYDHKHKEDFYLGSPNTYHPFWWGGEPIWVTVSNQQKISATYFWPGTDVEITRYPDYYHTFNSSIDNEERIYQAFDWLDMPDDKRPDFITLYVSSLDHEGHVNGPDSPEVDAELAVVDGIISILMNGLKLRNLDNCVNLILLADHGMAQQSCERLTYIDKYGVDMSYVNFYGRALGRIGKSKNESLWSQFNPQMIQDQLQCKVNESHFHTFLKTEYFPKRYHYVNHERIEDVQLVVDDQWLVGGVTGSTTFCNGGMHGYDNEYRSMHSLFLAHGPGFKRSYNTTEPFESIEVYNLMTDLMSLTPAPNNGTKGSMNHIMSQPIDIPKQPEGVGVAFCLYPDLAEEAPNTFNCTYCDGLSELEANSRLLLAKEESEQFYNFHLPYSRPILYAPGETEVVYCVAVQQDYLASLNIMKKIPFYVSYTLEDKHRDMVSPSSCVRPDFRFYREDQIKCSDYTPEDTVVFTFLYPPELSNGQAVYDALITTNTVPMYPPAAEVWNYMAEVLADWANVYGGVSVVAGPVFDYNHDGLPDTQEILQTQGKHVGGNSSAASIPTHVFLIVTRCKDAGRRITDCNTDPKDLEVLSFIIPNYAEYPCRKESQAASEWIPPALKQHVARVRDVELLTGLSFFSKWTSDDAVSQELRSDTLRLRLALPQFTSDWLQDFEDKVPPPAVTGVPPTTTSGSVRIVSSYIVLLFMGKLVQEMSKLCSY